MNGVLLKVASGLKCSTQQKRLEELASQASLYIPHRLASRLSMPGRASTSAQWRLGPMRWKREQCPPLPVFAVHAIAAIKAPDHCCDIEGDQECDEDDEYHHGVFFLSCFFSMSIVQKRVSTYAWIAVFPTFVIPEKEGRSYDLEHSVGVSLHTERRSM